MRIRPGTPLLACIVLLSTPLRAELIDGVAAYVNDEIITVGDVEAVFAPHRARLQRLYEGAELAARLRQAYREALEVMIERRLIVTDYDRRVANQELKIPDGVIQERVDAMMRGTVGDNREALMEALAREGTTMEEFREPFRDRVVVSILRSIEVGGKVRVSPQEVRREYYAGVDGYQQPARVKLSVIVIDLPGEEEEDAKTRRKATIILADLREGGSFSNAATVASEGRNAESGGDWGWYETAELRAELSDAIEGLDAGEVSDVVQIDNALYIIRLDQHEQAGVRDLAEVQAEIESRLRERKAARLYDEWIQRLRDQSYVKIVASGVPSGSTDAGSLSLPRE